MTPDQEYPIDDKNISHEVTKNRARIRNINDTVQDQRIRIAEHQVMLRVMQDRMDMLQTNMVTHDGLDAAVKTIELRIDNLKDDLAPIKRAIYWVAALIIGAVILGLVSGLIKH